MLFTETLEVKSEESRRNQCPRCRHIMRLTYQDREPECWTCGYVDYTYTPLMQAKESILGSGTQYLVRYIGKFPDMKERLVHIQLVRGGGTTVVRSHPFCPFCEKVMELFLLVGKNRAVSEDRYQCGEGHRISLLRDLNGDMGWK